MNNVFEQDKLMIRIPHFMYTKLEEDAIDFKFTKSNDEPNINKFINKLLPNLIEYRNIKKEELQEFLDENVKSCILPKMQEKVMEFLYVSYDMVYFNNLYIDDLESILNIRFSNANKYLITELFMYLEDLGINKSKYIRNLLNEYISLPKHTRLAFCFHEEFASLLDSVSNNIVCEFKYKDNFYSMIPITICVNSKKQWVFIGVDFCSQDMIYSFCLIDIKNVVLNKNKEFSISKEYILDINEFVNNKIYEMTTQKKLKIV